MPVTNPAGMCLTNRQDFILAGDDFKTVGPDQALKENERSYLWPSSKLTLFKGFDPKEGAWGIQRELQRRMTTPRDPQLSNSKHRPREILRRC
jgi:hypothetical protein